ncbi:hypothetical protein [Acinetobacter haemolyticus]|uniref:hypothetical protein n=1 Tax=Acinetobacter haemolyticus TaxID=29430 RepID=UPI001D0E8F04|nr:hypothetical protein [Acinetobacter haemolyticus]
MAVPEQTPLIEYIANGSTTNFALGFDCDEQDYLIVTLDEVEPPVGSWNLVGGSVIFLNAPSNGVKVEIKRNTPFSRTTDYQSYNNSFRPPAVNKDFDLIWWKLQELGVADWILGNGLKQEILDRIAADEQMLDYILNQDNALKADYIERDSKLKDYIDQMIALVTGDPSFQGIFADFVIDGDKNQHQINEEQKETNIELSTFRATSETTGFPMINVIRDRIVVDTYSKSGDSSHIQAINRAIIASRDYSQAAIHFNNHDYELDDTISFLNLSNLHMQFAGGRLVATTPSKNILAATGCNGLKFSDIKLVGLGAGTTQSADEFGLLFTSCNDLTLDGGQLSEARGQAALRLLDSHDSTIRDLTIDRYSYAGLQILGTSKNTKVKGFKILNGLGALSSGASGYGVHISVGNDQFPELIFLEDFEIIGNNWDGINSHGSGDVFVKNGTIREVKNGIEFAIDSRYENSYLKNINFENVDIECFNAPWNPATQGNVTNLSSGLSIASSDAGVRYCQGATIKNVNVKYANNSAGGTGDNAGMRLHGIKGLRVSGGSAKECKSLGMRIYGYIDDFAIRDFTAHDITGQGVLIGPNVSNGYIDDLKFGNSGGTEFTGLTAIQAGSTGTVNVIEKNTQLTTSNVTKYSSTAGVQLRLKQEYLDASFNPNNATYAANLAGFKVGDVVKSPTIFASVLYQGWMCTSVSPMTWKRYGATVS